MTYCTTHKPLPPEVLADAQEPSPMPKKTESEAKYQARLRHAEGGTT